MANLTKKEQHVAHLAKTAFPMDQGFAFTSSTGMILPVYQDLLNVGESVYINSQLIARSQPLVTAAMADIHFNIDWFFVPLSMLYTLFPNTRWNTNDVISDLYLKESSGSPSVVQVRYFPLCNIDATLFGTGINGYYSTEIKFGSSDGLDSDFGSARVLSFRLADMLGFNPRAAIMTPQTGRVDEFNPNVFPWAPLAYQAIYQNYYRDDDWERRRIDSYNLDSLYTSASMPFVGYSRGLFQLRFHRRFGDYFNVTKNQPYLNSINLVSQSSIASIEQSFRTALHDYLSDGDAGSYGNYRPSFVDREGNTGRMMSPGSLNDSGVPQFAAVTSSIFDTFSTGSDDVPDRYSSTASLRDMFAFEKLFRIIGMSKKDYDHQVLAHFGFKVPHDVKHELTHIFGQHGIMHIGEVVSTADTFDGESGSALGSIGGKGYAIINRDKQAHKFTAPVDGVLMAVTYSVPEINYIDSFDKQLAVTSPNDLFIPEFDKLGSQPLYNYEVLPFGNGASFDVLGWQYRYQQWKMKYNKASFAFYQNNTSFEVNTYSPWILTGRPFRQIYQVGVEADSLNFRSFLCDGYDINNIMQVPYNASWSSDYVNSPWLIYQTDPFIEVFKANVKKVSVMSPYGDPDLNGI